MNKRWILLLVLIVLGLLAWMLNQRSTGSTLDRPLSDFTIRDTARVDRIFITDQNGAVVDLRRSGDGWMLNNTFKAKKHDVDLLLRTFVRVEVRSPVPKSMEPGVLRVMGAASRRVEIYEGGRKPSKIWIVGHGTQDHFGTYMLLEKPGEGRSGVPFIIGMSGFTGILGPRFHTDLDSWRSSEVLRVADLYQIERVEVEHPQAPRESYRIENLERGRVRLTDLEGRPLPFDTTLVRGALLPYQQLNYEYIDRNISRHQRDSLLSTSPNQVLRVKLRGEEPQEMKFWLMRYQGEMNQWDPHDLHDKMRMHALLQDTLLVVVQRQMFDRLVQPASDLKP
jgi:hypothetical protein